MGLPDEWNPGWAENCLLIFLELGYEMEKA